jgi:hypothetical protein
MMRLLNIALVIVLAVGTLLLLAIHGAFGHSWYPVGCCSDKDCHPIPCTDLHVNEDGSATYKPNGEPYIRFNKVEASLDEGCHVCHHGIHGYCAFVPTTS